MPHAASDVCTEDDQPSRLGYGDVRIVLRADCSDADNIRKTFHRFPSIGGIRQIPESLSRSESSNERIYDLAFHRASGFAGVFRADGAESVRVCIKNRLASFHSYFHADMLFYHD